MRTEVGNEDRRGQEGDVFATQNTPRRLYKGARGVRASDLISTVTVPSFILSKTL